MANKKPAFPIADCVLAAEADVSLWNAIPEDRYKHVISFQEGARWVWNLAHDSKPSETSQPIDLTHLYADGIKGPKTAESVEAAWEKAWYEHLESPDADDALIKSHFFKAFRLGMKYRDSLSTDSLGSRIAKSLDGKCAVNLAEPTADDLPRVYKRMCELEADNVRLKDDTPAMCAYCSFEAPKGSTVAVLQKHVMTCEFHPLVKRIAELEAELAALKVK